MAISPAAIEPKCLWVILVPTINKNGNPIRTKFHKIWDSKVREISGGLSIFHPIYGQWIAPSKELFEERMIPVSIHCTEEEINKIADITAKYYEQKAIMYYKVSDTVIIKEY